MLTNIKWAGSGIATCTIPMARISYKIVARPTENPIDHTIAAGSCTGCSQVTARNSGYTCVQGATIDANCSGDWGAAYRVDITPPPGKTFTSTSGSCFPYLKGATCYAAGPQGVAPLFAASSSPCKATATNSARQTLAAAGAACYNNPPSGSVMLSLKAINEIRDYHFPGGSRVDDTKGLFLDKVTNRDLANILDKGLQDSGPWVLNKSNYYEKTFAYSGVGNRSSKYGKGLPSTAVTLVVEKFADKYGVIDVVTMYPADS